MLTRRQALLGGMALAGGAAAPGLGTRAGLEAEAAAPADLSSWRAIRKQFALRPDRAHLDAFVFSSPPRSVREAIAGFQRALDSNPALYVDMHDDRLAHHTRSAAAAYLGVPADQIALTDSTTMGLGLFYAGLRVRPGQELLTTVHDFYSTHEGLRFAAERNGTRVRHLRLYGEPETATRDGILATVRRGIGPRTRILAVTWVHSSTGVRLPIAEIAALVAAANRGRRERDRILLCVDGVHGFGAEAADAHDLGCDVLMTGCHKWLYGPRGTGIVWATEPAWRATTPTIPSFDVGPFSAWLSGRSARPGSVPAGQFMTPGGYHSFEQRWALSAAFAFHQAIGRDRIAERIHELAARFKAGLYRIPGVRVRTPADPGLSGGIVCFEVHGRSPSEVVAKLLRRGVQMSVTPYVTEYVRAGFPLPVLEGDVDRAVAAVRELVR